MNRKSVVRLPGLATSISLACYTAAHDKLKKHNATLRVHEFDMFIHHYAYLLYVQNVHVCTKSMQYSVILRTKLTSPYCIVC